MSTENFVIENGVLLKYNGSDEFVTIPDSVTEIGSSAFLDCKTLVSVTIPDSVTKINKFAFRNCTSLSELNLGNNVAEIGYLSFHGCKNLVSVTFPEGVRFIDVRAFVKCENLESVTFPSSLEVIAPGAFGECYKIFDISVPDGIPLMKYRNERFLGSDSKNSFFYVKIYLLGEGTRNEDFDEGCRSLIRKFPVTTVKDVVLPTGSLAALEKILDACTSLPEEKFKVYFEEIKALTDDEIIPGSTELLKKYQ